MSHERDTTSPVTVPGDTVPDVHTTKYRGIRREGTMNKIATMPLYIDMSLATRGILGGMPNPGSTFYVGVYLHEGVAYYGRPRLWRPMAFNDPDYIVRVKFKQV